MLKDDCDSEHLKALSRAHRRMETMIDDILTISQQHESKMETNPVSLTKMVEDCWQNVETVEARLDVESERTIRADKGRFKQLLENLVRNAIEHGGGDVMVKVGDLDGGFYVGDDGVGFPETRRDDLFEPGYTTKSSGTGFGLSIVKQVADVHVWEIHMTEGDRGDARIEFTGIESP